MSVTSLEDAVTAGVDNRDRARQQSDCPGLFSAVQRHSRYRLAVAMMDERFPSLVRPAVSYPAVIAIICLAAQPGTFMISG